MIKYTRKTFIIMYPTFEKFKEKVIDNAVKTTGLTETPFYLDDSKRPFNSKLIYNALINNGAENWLSLNNEKVQNGKMINWYISISIKLSGKMINLQKEFFEKLDAKNLLSNLTDTYNIDAENLYNVVENIYSESPLKENIGKGTTNKPKDKTLTIQINKSKVRQEFIDIAESLKKSTFDFADAISKIINDPTLKNMWEINPELDAEIKLEGLIDLTSYNKLLVIKVLLETEIKNLENFTGNLISLSYFNSIINTLKTKVDNLKLDFDAEKLNFQAEIARLDRDISANLLKINSNTATLADKLNKIIYDNHLLEFESLKNKVNGIIQNPTIDPQVAENIKAISKNRENININLNNLNTFKSLNLEKKGIYKDIGGTLSNDNLKNAFEGGDGNNDEYLVLNDIINNSNNLFKNVEGKEIFALISGNWFLDHFKKGQNLGSDFSRMGNSDFICFYKENNNLIHIIISNFKITNARYTTLNKITGNYSSFLKPLDFSIPLNWINNNKVLNYDTPIFIDNEFKEIQNSFIKKEIESNLKMGVPIFAVRLTKATNDPNFSNDGVEIVANNKNYMQDKPVIVEKKGNNIRLTINYKNPLPFGIFNFKFLLIKSGEFWVNLKLVNDNLFSKYTYESKSNYSSSARAGTWKSKLTNDNKIILECSGQKAEINYRIGNNNFVWIVRSFSSSRSFSLNSYGTHQEIHNGEIRSNDNSNISGSPLIIDIIKRGGGDFNLDAETIFIQTEEIGG